jgi:cell shape-determining protein MreD
VRLRAGAPVLRNLAVALSVGLSSALVVGILALVDSNQQEPAGVVVGHVVATAFWVTLVVGIVIALKRKRR